VKNKAAKDGVGPSTNGGISRRLFAQDIKDELFVTDSTLYVGMDVNAPGHNRRGHNSVFCCRRTSYDRTRRVFLLKIYTNEYL